MFARSSRASPPGHPPSFKIASFPVLRYSLQEAQVDFAALWSRDINSYFLGRPSPPTTDIRILLVLKKVNTPVEPEV